MYPHRIRLRGPWECRPLARAGELSSAPFRVDIPCLWSEAGLSDFTGRVRFVRRFGYPGRIDSHERVWLTFEGLSGEAEIRLNDNLLGRRNEASGVFEFEVTPLLRPRNELIVEIEGSAERGGLWGEVALEVRCTAFLRDVARIAMLKQGRCELRVTGCVTGSAERPLEIYVVLDRSPVAYQVVTAEPAGRRFEVVVADLAPEPWRDADGRPRSPVVKVDLVNGATVWHTDEAELAIIEQDG